MSEDIDNLEELAESRQVRTSTRMRRGTPGFFFRGSRSLRGRQASSQSHHRPVTLPHVSITDAPDED